MIGGAGRLKSPCPAAQADNNERRPNAVARIFMSPRYLRLLRPSIYKPLCVGFLLAGVAILSGCALPFAHSRVGPDHIVGRGAHHYRFTLLDPSGKVAANTPFALSLRNDRDLPFVREEKDVWRGVTDAEGRTPVIALPFAIKPADMFMRGDLATYPMGSNSRPRIYDFALSLYPYRLIICTNPPQYMIGLTDKGGNTFYGASQRPVSILLLMGWMPPPDGITMCQDGDVEVTIGKEASME